MIGQFWCPKGSFQVCFQEWTEVWANRNICLGLGSDFRVVKAISWIVCLFPVLLPLSSFRRKILSRISWHWCFRHFTWMWFFSIPLDTLYQNLRKLCCFAWKFVCGRWSKKSIKFAILVVPIVTFYNQIRVRLILITAKWKVVGNIPWSLRWTNFICSVQVFDPGVCNMAKRSSFVYIWAPDESMCQSLRRIHEIWFCNVYVCSCVRVMACVCVCVFVRPYRTGLFKKHFN